MDLAILHQDDHLCAVDKPSGLLVHRSAWSGDEDESLARLVSERLGRRAHPVHRLDRGTSGVVLFALTAEAARAVQELFAQGLVRKQYLAIVRGTPPDDTIVDHAIPRGEENAERVPAITRVQRLATASVEDSPLREKSYSLVLAEPRTGRFHQVRRHLKHIGHPVLGDANYGRAEHTRLVRERFDLARLALHASAIELPHPVTRIPLQASAPLPPDLADPARRMGLFRAPDGLAPTASP